MLATIFQIASITQTPITSFEIEIHNEIRYILKIFKIFIMIRT